MPEADDSAAASPPDPPTGDPFVFDAFLSCSDGDQGDDPVDDIADRMERSLETFPLSRSLRREYLNGNYLNVFRDDSDLPGAEFERALQKYLGESRTLVVLWSSAARKSTQVDSETRWFAKNRDHNQIFPVLVSGSPNYDPKAHPDDWAFPEALGGMPFVPDFRQPMAKFGVSHHPVLRWVRGIRDDAYAARVDKVGQALGVDRSEKLARGSP